jgi:hypothetical protein
MDVITKDEVVMVLRSEADLYEERSKTDKRMNLVVEILLDRIKEIEGDKSW